MKNDTLNVYRDRLDRARREMATYMNGMSIGDPAIERSNKVFAAGREIADILYGDDIRPDTVEISNKLKSFEKSVKRLVNRLPEDAQVTVEDLPMDTDIIQGYGVAGDTVTEHKVHVPEQQGNSKAQGLALIAVAGQQMMKAHQILCSGHRALRNLTELKALEDASKTLNLIMRDINRLDL